jgi:hypothetical protein
MTEIEGFLEAPGDKDVPVSAVFTEEMFTELEKRMDGVGWDNVRPYWDKDFKNRKIISGFMKVSRKNGGGGHLCWYSVHYYDQHCQHYYFSCHIITFIGSSLGKQALSFNARSNYEHYQCCRLG